MEYDPTGANITAVIAIGIGVAFVITDRAAATSCALAACLICVGLAIIIDVNWVLSVPVETLPAWSGLAALPSVVAMIAASEWVLRVRQTIPARGLRTEPANILLRAAQGLAVFHLVTAVLFYQERVLYFLSGFDQGLSILAEPKFYVFAAPFDFGLLAIGLVTLVTLNRRPDLPEALRMIGFAVGAPFIAAGLVLPPGMAPYSVALGEVIILAAALNYHVLQGRRGAFMGRFMAPQVARLVRERGLERAIDNRSLELSVVACDVRGFTAYAESVPSDRVIEALNNYYRLIGQAAARYGATIKDYAGDGVLMLVGAPLPYPDHAERAVGLARTILRNGAALVENWDGQSLGVGVGVASGRATVGVVGDTRLEYAAVGAVVNRAARLADAAASGEVLCDERSVELLTPELRGQLVDGRRRVSLKGIGDNVPAWVLAPGEPPEPAPLPASEALETS